MRILALDLSLKTGWASSAGQSGVYELKLKRGESVGMRWLRFRVWLRDLIILTEPTLIIYEQSHHRGGAATHVAETLIGLVEAAAAQQDIELTNYHTSEIKKHATGKGNASKAEMLAAAKERWPGIEIIDDNHADALFLLSLSEEELGESGRKHELEN